MENLGGKTVQESQGHIDPYIETEKLSFGGHKGSVRADGHCGEYHLCQSECDGGRSC